MENSEYDYDNSLKENSDDLFSEEKSYLYRLLSEEDSTVDKLLIKNLLQKILKIEKRENEINKISSSISNANAESAEIIAEEEYRNEELVRVNKKLAEANANAAELMAEIETKNDKIQILNKSLSKANAEASELIVEIESQKDELKKAHEELNLLNKHLEIKVQERTAEIRHLLNEKDEFINELAHDLRTPLTPLINLTPMLKTNEEDPKRQELLDIILNNVDRIHRIVKKTVKIANLNAPSFKLDKKNTNLHKKINDVIDNIGYDKNRFEIVNNSNENLETLADEELINDIFFNLIDNALKFSPDGGKIIIDTNLLNDEIQISIKDHV
jgi:signal transduction histidine kinase